MVTKARFAGATTVFFLTPACQRRQNNFLQARHLPYPACDLVAVHSRHSNVQEHCIRCLSLQHFKRRRPTMGHPDLMALQLEQHRQTNGSVLVVIDH